MTERPDTPEIQSFKCPSCGAALKAIDAPSVTCTYCGSDVLVPPEYRPHKPQVTVIQMEAPAISDIDEFDEGYPIRPRASSCGVLWALLGVLIILVVGLIVINPEWINAITNQAQKQIAPLVEGPVEARPQATARPARTPAPTPIPYASMVLNFGSEGKDDGLFQDPRYIALDAQGNIYVADFSTGRVQQFGPDSKFIQLIQVPSEDNDDDIYLGGLATDGAGRLYVLREGDILQYDPATGKLLSTISDRWPTIYYDSLTSDGQDMLYATNGMAGTDDLIKLNTQGKLLAHWKEIIEPIEDDDPAVILQAAVSPSGEIFVLSPVGRQVYVYDAEGKFLRRFGEKGDAPGQFSSVPDAIVVDSQGRVYIANSYSIDQYDAQGVYTGHSITLDYSLAGGVPRDMAFDAQGDLYIITSGERVLKYHINKAP